MTDHTSNRILYALFCLSRDTCAIDATALARAVGVSATEAAHALVELERAGLVDASRARLTMSGLARAAQLDAGGAGGPAVDLRHARPRARHIAPPLAARPQDSPTEAPHAPAAATTPAPTLEPSRGPTSRCAEH